MFTEIKTEFDKITRTSVFFFFKKNVLTIIQHLNHARAPTKTITFLSNIYLYFFLKLSHGIYFQRYWTNIINFDVRNNITNF